MKLNRFVVIVVLSILLFSHAGIAQGTAQGKAPGAAPDPSLQTEIINDPTFGGIKAFTVNIPAAWKFQGTVIAGVGCNLPSPVFRAYSPDGLTEIRLLSSFFWEVREKSASGWEGLDENEECIYLNGPMTAAQFLDRYVRTLGPVHVVGPMSVSAGYQRQLDRLVSRVNANQPKDPKARTQSTGDAAAVRIEATNGTFTIEQRTRARIVCSVWPKAIAGKLGGCFARVDVLRAPKGQLDALVNIVDSHNLTNAKNDDVWLQRWVAEIKGEPKNHFDPYVPNQDARAMLFRQASDFDLVPGQGEKPPPTPFTPGRYTMNPDWTDFALDPKRLYPDGRLYLASALHIWFNSSGQQYRTRDPDANPNGVFAGQWKEQIVDENPGPQ